MDTPARDCATALSPSDTLSVTAFPTKMVSADKRLISSPVLVRSKKAVSCLSMELNSLSRSLLMIFWPGEVYRILHKATNYFIVDVAAVFRVTRLKRRLPTTIYLMYTDRGQNTDTEKTLSFLPEIWIRYTLPKLAVPPKRKTPHKILQTYVRVSTICAGF